VFHANAWGFPYAALMAGASLALPCRQTDPASLMELIEVAQVTMATAVPTVWISFLEHLKKRRGTLDRISSLRRLPVGGAAIGQSLIDDFARYGIDVMHCWGMTEISPLGRILALRTMA
jgi:fatty-acyl-CoA synthase